MKHINMNIKTALVLSDIHLEWDGKNPVQFSKVFPERWADAVFLAGDIAGGLHAMPLIEHFLSLGYEVFYTPGNHEFYGHHIDTLVDQWRQLEREAVGFHFMHKDVVEVGNLRILGAPLWASIDTLRVHPLNGVERVAVDGITRMKMKEMQDFRSIRKFPVEGMIEAFWDQYNWLVKELEKPCEKPFLIMTHYLPSERSVDPVFKNSPLNPAFYTELSHLMHEFDIRHWFHGHTHASCCYTEGNTDVFCNPRGYKDINMVNPKFEWKNIVTVKA